MPNPSSSGFAPLALTPWRRSGDGLIAGLRLLKEEGLITNVSLGMNANADHKVVTPGAGTHPPLAASLEAAVHVAVAALLGAAAPL